MQRLFDTFESYDVEFFDLNDIKESGDLSDLGEIPKGVLGIFKVKHAFGAGVPFGISRNGRLYTKEAWDNALKKDPQFKEAYENKMVVGMLSHPEEDLSYDDMLREELASHLLKEIKYKEITKNSGIYEATFYILDTKAGRTLKAILSAGAKPAVSTRAYGSFKEDEFFEYKGKKLFVIDEKDFKLVTLDVVATPGIKNARFSEIKLTEQLKEDLKYLEEKSKEYKCDFGLCELLIENSNSNTNKNLEINEEKNNDDLKTKFKEAIKVLSEENKKLLEQINNKEKEFDEVFVKTFLSFVELLTKLLRYNKYFEKEYEELIEILDKDNKFEKHDIDVVKKVLDKIESYEFSSESLKTLANKIRNFLDTINDDENSKKESLKKVIESSILFFYDLIANNNDLNKKVQDLEKNSDFYKIYIDNLKKMLKTLGINLSEKVLHEKEKNTHLIKKIKKLHEKLEENKKINEKLGKLENFEKLLENTEFFEELMELSKNPTLLEKLEKLLKNPEFFEKYDKFMENTEFFEELVELSKNPKFFEKLEKLLKNPNFFEKFLAFEEILQENEKLKEKIEKNLELEKKCKELEKEKEKLKNEAETFKVKFLIQKYKISESQAQELKKLNLDVIEKRIKEMKKEKISFEIKEEEKTNEIEERILRLIK